MTAFEIDDGEPPVREADRSQPEPPVIRSAVLNGIVSLSAWRAGRCVRPLPQPQIPHIKVLTLSRGAGRRDRPQTQVKLLTPEPSSPARPVPHTPEGALSVAARAAAVH